MEFFLVNPRNKKRERLNNKKLLDFIGEKKLNIGIEFSRERMIGLAEVKQLLALYKEMLNHAKSQSDEEPAEGRLDILLYNNIKNFDLTFIAALNLVKFSFEKITICLFFDRLTPGSEEEECFYRFGQFAAASYLACGKEICSIVRNGRPVNPDFFLKNLSGYLPFLYVNADRFEQLFLESIKKNWEQWWDNLKPEALDGLGKKSNQADKIYQELRHYVIANIDFKGDQGQNFLNFYIIYLFNAVRKFHFIKRVLKNQLQKPVFSETGIGIDEESSPLGIKLSREADQEYEDKVQLIFAQILEKPPAFVMLFSYFIEVFYDPQPGEKATYAEKINTRIDFISKIFYFTDEIFYGVRELAKNIIEHSTNHRGVIIGRALSRDYLPGLKKGLFVEEFLRARPEEEKDFIDFIILDDGSRGIIEQTIKNLEHLESEFYDHPDFVGKFKEDIENLKIGNIKLEDFFNPGEIKLKYQEIRSAMSVGLLIFSHLVLENKGYMMVSSPHQGKVEGMALFEKWENRRDIKEIVPLGTFYNIIFLKILKRLPAPRSETIPFEMPSGESAFNTLLKHIIPCGDNNIITSAKIDADGHKDKRCSIDFQPSGELAKENFDRLYDVLKKCDNCSLQGKSVILAIDLQRAYKFDHSDLFRFLARIQQTRDVRSIIVYNVKEEIVKRFIDIFKIFKKMKRNIGSSDHYVLFYYQPPGPVSKYFSFLLAGESLEDMCWINEKIARTGYTNPDILQKLEWDYSRPTPQFEKNFYMNPLFTRDGNLLPFDVLIKVDGLTLFENNVLANLLEPGMHPASPSYTFKAAHMRLGSKIHLTDFFYARRIFQNSFYSLRFAYLVCRYIQENLHEWLDLTTEKNKSITILGYGMYSELLISNVAMFLKSVQMEWQFNHAVIDDPERLEVQGIVGPNVILLIPISSTLSTSHKIEMHLKKTYYNSRIIGNPISIMIVGNGALERIIDGCGTIIDSIVSRFWKHLDIDRKIITTRSPEKTGNQEKFFLYLPSQWYLARDCELCFPENPAEETVLFEADKVSVTPSLIFELPAPKQPTPLAEKIYFGTRDRRKKEQDTAILTEDMLSYGHTYHGSNHYLYYVYTDKFFKENEVFLKTWLKKIKNELKEKRGIFDSKVILIAPTHFTNSDFINLVNEIVFNDAATLFHYDQDEDYIQNLKSFFGQDIGAEAFVFFIDDAVCGGSTYEKLDNFVKYARAGKDSRGMDGAIVLINRLMQDKYSVFIKELDKAGFFVFVDLEVPIMIDSARFCHLCSERTRYEKMLSETLLDSLRILIRAKILKLEAKKYEEKDKDDFEVYKDIEWKYIPKGKCHFADKTKKNQANYLKRLEYTHRLYRAFADEITKEKIKQLFNDDKNLEHLCKEAGISYSTELKLDKKVDLIKVLSNPYFVYHKEIRKYIFKIVIRELENTTRSLRDSCEIKLGIGALNNYRYLKFLIKRAAALKANYIIRVEILEKIFSIYHMLQSRLQEEEKDQKILDMYSFQSRDKNEFLENLNGFVDYYLMAVKEVSWYNEANSLKLEDSLTVLENDHKNIDETFLFLTHSLRIENISIPYRFLKSLENQLGDIALSFDEQNYSIDIGLLSDFVINYCLEYPYRSAPLLAFLRFEKEPPLDEDESFEIKSFLEANNTFRTKILPIILLKAFLLHGGKKKEENIREKPAMDYILYCLCKILDIDTDSGGSFFVARHMKEAQQPRGANFFTISHIGKHKEIDSFDWERSFTSKMFFGHVPSFKSMPLTYMQILKKGETLYTHYDEKIDRKELAEIEQLRDMGTFLFLRLADDDLDSTARGVIVFYAEKAAGITPANLRYAMILKNDIFDFLDKNYESYSFKLYEEKLRQLKELEALNRVIAKVTSAAGLMEVYQAVKSAGAIIWNIDEMCLLTKRDDNFEPNIKCDEQIVRDCDRCKPIKLEYINKECSYKPYYCPDLEKDSRLRAINNPEIKSQFIISLVFNNELLGLLALGSKTRNAFSPFERNLLTSLGSQVAIAINQLKYDKQSEIYRDISHSLGTYLTNMRSITQRLIEGKVKGEAKKAEYLKLLYGELFAFINSVDEISGLANLEYWDTASISEKVELMEIVNNLAVKNKFLLEEKLLRLKISSTVEKVYVKANKQKLEDAFQSLMNNAIKFTDKNKDIEIIVSAAGEYAVIKIKDQGYGIDKDDLERIFIKNERGKNAKAMEIIGSGIGLAVAKNIIERHSGDITVESELGKGSTFTVQLPVLRVEGVPDINKKEVKSE